MLSRRLLWKDGKDGVLVGATCHLVWLRAAVAEAAKRRGKRDFYLSQCNAFLLFFDGLKLARYDASSRD